MTVMVRHIVHIILVGALLAPVVPLAQTIEPRAPQVTRQAVAAERFTSPEEGFAALAEAARRRDATALSRVLGDEGRRLLRSGDETSDATDLERFAAAYGEKHTILRPASDRAVLQVGADDWPLPIPMRRSGSAWRFDARAGAQEIVDRRVGRNELDTIQTLRAIADAQDEFARTVGREGGLRVYARRFVSSPGKRDGLYWPAAPNEPPSPLGAIVARASAANYRLHQADDPPRPINGYFFDMLEAQGPSAPGGAMSYLVGDRLIGGFAVIAWPAEYGASGIQTFMISHDGRVWQRNFGRDTARLARRITSFDPDDGWQLVPE